MKSAETLLACCVVGLACFIGGQAVGVRDRAGHDRALRGEAAGAIDVPGVRRVGDRVGDRVTDRTESDAPFVPATAAHGEARLVTSPRAAGADRPALAPEAMRRRIAQGLAGTYMPSLLRTRDSALTRWADRTTRPLRVFLRDGDGIPGWTPDQLPAVRDAFDTWTRAGIPVRFTFVTDSASADVHVRFTAGFANGISGKTVWSRDADFWIVAGAIQLAVAHPGGGAVTPPQMRAIALHEVGHLLGLDHADSPDDIMAARVRARDLSDADRATVRLLYTVPAGSLK
ncbi:MAG: matrixin family metalloprotease [Gemmatimonadota bacterium]|nr:matrixin family metalloprotease [Gemmatimonadota bacterium]